MGMLRQSIALSVAMEAQMSGLISAHACAARPFDPLCAPTLRAALVGGDTHDSPVWGVAAIGGSAACPVLGERLAAMARRSLAGIPVVLVCRDAHGDWRTFGDQALVRSTLK